MTRLAPFVILLLCSSGASAQEDVKTLKLQLKMGKETYACGQIPQFDLRWVNGSETEKQVVRPCDGSQAGARFPGYVWSIERVDGKPLTKQKLGRCGNVNSLKAEDFVLLAPKGVHAVKVATNNAWLSLPGDGTTWLDSGRYRVSLTYTFDPKYVERCYGFLNGDCPPDLQKRIKSTPALKQVTNTVEFEIAKPTPAEAKRLTAWKAVKPGWTLAQVTEALGAADTKKTQADQTTLGFKLGELTLEVSLQKGKVTSSYVRDWK